MICQAIECGGAATSLVTGPTARPLKLCDRCTSDAIEIGNAFGERVSVRFCSCEHGGACAVHGYESAVRS